MPLENRPPLQRTSFPFLLALLCLIGLVTRSDCAQPKLSGLQFPAGQPADNPPAKVAVEEVVQGAQKRGFLKIALLPLAAVNGLQIHFNRPDPAVFAEITETLRSLVRMDAQEYNRIEIFAPGDPVPRFTADHASPGPEGWIFKKARFRCPAFNSEIADCSLSFSGPTSGQFSSKSRQTEGARTLPALAELLKPNP